jgi:hypothetical protein
MVPVMEAVSRAVYPHPVVTVSRVDSQGSVHPAYRAANRAADDSANRTSGGTALCSTLPHSSENALSMNHGRSRKQSRYCGKLQHLQHVCLQITA